MARFLEEALRSEGHEVHVCPTLEALKNTCEVSTDSFDVAIFDRMLRGEDSLTVLPQFKHTHQRCKVLILSAINSSEEKANALDAGADDYMGKPYSFVELSARIRVLARREATTSVPQITCRDLLLDPITHQAFVKGRRVDFSAKEFRLLLVLARKPGQVFNKFQLLDKVWDVQADIESNVVESTVRNVRRKLEEAGAEMQLCNRRNVGYWIEN